MRSRRSPLASHSHHLPATDPIQSWPSPGFTLGFGRIIYYDGYTDGNQITWHKFMLIDADGTRHALGLGQDYGN